MKLLALVEVKVASPGNPLLLLRLGFSFGSIRCKDLPVTGKTPSLNP